MSLKCSNEIFIPPQAKLFVISHACIRATNRKVYRALQLLGIEVQLVVPSELKTAGHRIPCEPQQATDPTIHKLEMSGTNLRLARYRGLLKLLKRFKPSAVFLESDTASFLTLEVATWCRRNGIGVACLTNENLAWSWREATQRAGVKELPAAFFKLALNGLTRRSLSHVMVTSSEAKRVFEAAHYKSVITVPLGTDRKIFNYSSKKRSQMRSHLGIGPEEHIIAYFGRLVPEKGIDTLIEALSSLRDLPWRIILNRFEVNSVYASHLSRLIERRGISDRVIEVTAQHGEIALAMSASDVVVLPSLSTSKWVEQFGRVVPEAMACGNLVLVSDSGAPKELIGRSGLVFREGNALGLAALLRNQLADKVGCIMRRRAGIRHVHRTLSVEVQARLMASVVEQLSRGQSCAS